MTTIPETSVHELKTLKDNNADFFLLDVRDQWEYDICNLEGHLIPIKDLPQRLGELNPAQKIVVHCQAGGRSSRATQFLLQQGFADVSNLSGGILAWTKEIDPKMPKY
jgi:rhodanese-related sulfurtransferase